jgi:uncharacterized protein
VQTLTGTDQSPMHRGQRQDRRPRKLRGSLRISVAEVALAAFVLYPLIALALAPETSSSTARRSVTFVVICATVATVVAVARPAPSWLRGIGMLVAGFAGMAVTGGVIVKRVAAGMGVREVAGILFAMASAMLVVLGWRLALQGIKRKWARVSVATVSSLLVVQLALLPAIFALDVTHRARPRGSDRTPTDVGLVYRDVRITTPDGVSLAAWWISSSNGAAVLVLPGSGSTRDDVLDHAALLAQAGYGALLLDWRGHGASEGRLNELGWGADGDVRTAVSWVLRQPDVTKGVGLLGLSMGGEVAVTEAAADLRVGAVVAEGVSVRTLADARQRANEWAIPFENDALMFGLVSMLGSESPPGPLADAFRYTAGRPVLLIAGSDPQEAELGPVYASSAPATVTLWALPDTGHTRALFTHPAEYRARVLSLFDTALPAR